DPSWTLAGTGDFNGDGKADLIWRNSTNGLFTEWQSNGNGFTPNTYVGNVDTSWTLAATNDFNGDGKADLLWRNGSGVFTEWQSTGSGFTPNVDIDSVASSWVLASKPTHLTG